MGSWNLTAQMKESADRLLVQDDQGVPLQTEHFTESGPQEDQLSKPFDFYRIQNRFRLASPLFAHSPHVFIQLWWVLEFQWQIPILPRSLSFRDLEGEGSVVLSGHQPGTGPQAFWGKFDWQF